MPISSFYYYIQADQIIPSIPSHSRVSRRHQLLSPNPLPLFNSPSPATAQKPLPPIRHICGLGASVGCERVERTFNAPRLKAQIWLMKFTGFVCSLSNELNSKKTYIYFTVASVLILHPCVKVIMHKGKDGLVMEVREIYKISDMIHKAAFQLWLIQ